MKDLATWVVLGVAILFCGVISLVQLALVLQGRGSGALVLFLVSTLVMAGLIAVGGLRIWRGKKFWE
jgi:hypothetical protein